MYNFIHYIIYNVLTHIVRTVFVFRLGLIAWMDGEDVCVY